MGLMREREREVEVEDDDRGFVWDRVYGNMVGMSELIWCWSSIWEVCVSERVV